MMNLHVYLYMCTIDLQSCHCKEKESKHLIVHVCSYKLGFVQPVVQEELVRIHERASPLTRYELSVHLHLH